MMILNQKIEVFYLQHSYAQEEPIKDLGGF